MGQVRASVQELAGGLVDNLKAYVAAIKDAGWDRLASTQGKLMLVPLIPCSWEASDSHSKSPAKHAPWGSTSCSILGQLTLSLPNESFWAALPNHTAGPTHQDLHSLWSVNLRYLPLSKTTQLNNQSHHGSEMCKYLFQSLFAICFVWFLKLESFQPQGMS